MHLSGLIIGFFLATGIQACVAPQKSSLNGSSIAPVQSIEENLSTATIRGGDEKTIRKLTSIELACAGAFATVIGDLTMHPIDCIKTLQQSTEGRGLSMIGASQKILQKSGPAGFFSGVGTYVVSDGLAGSVKFSSYEAMKLWVDSKVPEEYRGTALFGIAAIAFLASSVVLVPGELIKQRLQMGQIQSVPEGIKAIWKADGFFGFYRGYFTVCLRDVPYTMMELGIYDNIKRTYLKFKKARSEGQKVKITQFDEILAAAVAGGITGYLTNPLDTMKTKLMVNPELYNGFVDCVRKNVAQDGMGALFAGAAARVAWIMPFTAMYLPIYEIVKRRLEILPAPTLFPVKSPAVKGKALKVKGGSQKSIIFLRNPSRKSIPHPRTYRLQRSESFVSF